MESRRCTLARFMKYMFRRGSAESLILGFIAVCIGTAIVVNPRSPGFSEMTLWMYSGIWFTLFAVYGMLKIFLCDRNLFPKLEATVSILGIWLWTTVLLSYTYFNKDSFRLPDVFLVVPLLCEVLMLAFTIKYAKEIEDARQPNTD